VVGDQVTVRRDTVLQRIVTLIAVREVVSAQPVPPLDPTFKGREDVRAEVRVYRTDNVIRIGWVGREDGRFPKTPNAGSLHELEAKHSTLCNQIQELVFQIQNSSSTAQQLENQNQDAKSRLDYCNYQLQIKEKELAVLDSAINRKKRIIQRLDNSGGYSRIKEAAKKEAKSILQNHHVLLTLLVSIVLESVKRYPANQELIYELTFGSATPNQPMMELHKTQLLQLSKHIHAELLARITRITTDDMENTIAG
ncbi:MAG: hypothetical protein QOA08_07340, partial [Nitrososphaeraceae archaeon]|nr:hypothetical protein [Nitrososphaeraceae archaeon]